MKGSSFLKIFLTAIIAFTLGATGFFEDLELPYLHFGDYAEGYEDGYNDGKNDWKEVFYEKGYEDGVLYGKGLQAAASRVGTVYKSSNVKPSKSTSISTVYVTDTGSKYHKWGCQYLRESCIEISYVDATSDGYTPCSKCF